MISHYEITVYNEVHVHPVSGGRCEVEPSVHVAGGSVRGVHPRTMPCAHRSTHPTIITECEFYCYCLQECGEGHLCWYPFFGFQVTSPLGFKDRCDVHSLRSTSGATHCRPLDRHHCTVLTRFIHCQRYETFVFIVSTGGE